MAMMIFGTIGIMGLAYTELHKGHIRIDILYGRFSPRVKAILDIGGAVVLLFPLMYALLKTSIPWTISSWVEGEIRHESYLYPPAAPFRTVLVVGIFLFTLQSVATFVRSISVLWRKKSND